jgi:hypothetical protein
LKEQFPDKTIIVKDTAKQVVEACDITYAMLSTPEASRAVFLGDDGVLAGVSDGKSIVDCATLAVEDMQRMSEAVVAKGGYVSDICAHARRFAGGDVIGSLSSHHRVVTQPFLGSTRFGIQGPRRTRWPHFPLRWVRGFV